MTSTVDDSELPMLNLMLFTALLEDKDITEKITEMNDILKSGADVNAADAENNYDTPLHVALRCKQKDIVKLLLQWDADVTRLNGDDRSALYVARGLGGADSKDIKDMIEQYAKEKHVTSEPVVPSSPTATTSGTDTNPKRVIQRANTIEVSRYLKRNGTTGVGGQLYKSKALCLVLLRASNDKDICEKTFYLGTNLPGMGAFYDVCFRYSVKDFGKSIRLFMQCKHLPTESIMTEDDLRNADGDWSLPNCYDSFLNIKDKFGSDVNDPIFGEDFNNVETNFVLYTSSKDKLKKKFYGNTGLSPKIQYLINTADNPTVFRFNHTEEDLDFITKEVQKRRMTSLAHCLINYIFTDKNNYKDMMNDKLINTYHVALAQNVFQISTSEKEDFREATLRRTFFQNNDAFLSHLRETLCKLTVKNYHNRLQFGSEEFVNLFKQLPNVPSGEELSMFIGFLVKFDEKNNMLKLMNDLPSKGFSDSEIRELRESLKQIHVNPTTIHEATLIAGEKILTSVTFKVPLSFGNIDLAITEHGKIFNNIVSVFAYLFNYYRNTKVIELNETNVCKYIKSDGQVVTTEFLQNDDGIGSAIGNLLVLDNDTGYLKFNTTTVLSKPGTNLLRKLRSVLPRGEYIESYRLNIDFQGCPRISFKNNDYDKTLAKYFLSRLWFYTHQKPENKIDEYVKREVNKYYNAHKGPAAFGLCTHIDSIYSTFHDELQKWWMVTPENRYAPYLSQHSEIFRIAQEGVIDNPLLTLHHEMYLSKLRKIGIEFTSEAVTRLQLYDATNRLVNIKTDCNILTSIKIQQHYRTKANYNFIDFDYMLSLSADDRYAIINELKQTTVDILIVVCGTSKSVKPAKEDLHRVIHMFKGEKVLVVTENGVNSTTTLCIPSDHHLIKDEMNDFIHLAETSQENFARDTTLIFQDMEVCLSSILDETSEKFINAKILSKLLNNERIEIGHKLTNTDYENVQDYYIARCLEHEDCEDPCPVNSIDDIQNDVVVLITKHGMGKSTLLTHIALESKKADPTRWIVRINLRDYINQFYEWQNVNAEINTIETLKFLCIASLKYVDEKTVFQIHKKNMKIILDCCATTESKVLFELQLFLHYYNEHRIAFLFYGFDYVCPPFGHEVITMLKGIQGKVPFWVTSHSVDIPKKMLEEHFGNAYNLQPIDQTGQASFFYKFWKSNVRLEKINNELFSNLWDFLEFMLGKDDIHEHDNRDRVALPVMSLMLHTIYLWAVKYFQTELSNISFKHIHKKLKEHLDVDLNRAITLGSYMDGSPEARQAAELAGTPLHMYVAANYFQYKLNGRFLIKPDQTALQKKWDLWRDAVDLYQNFLEENMSRICAQSDFLNCSESQESDKRREFFDRHKKVALLAICREEDLHKLLPEDEIEDLKNTVKRIRTGEEKSALVDCVFDNVPRFFHCMYAEYCAVDMLAAILKCFQYGSTDHMRLSRVWDFIVNILLFSGSNSVRSSFDYKLKHDPELAAMASSDDCKNIIFELLLKQTADDSSASNAQSRSSLQAAVDSGMNNLVKLLLTSLDINLTKESVRNCLKVFQITDLALMVVNICGGDMPRNVTSFFSDMRLNKFVDVVKSERTRKYVLDFVSMIAEPHQKPRIENAVTTTQRHILNRVDDKFGLSQENIALFRQVANKIREYASGWHD